MDLRPTGADRRGVIGVSAATMPKPEQDVGGEGDWQQLHFGLHGRRRADGCGVLAQRESRRREGRFFNFIALEQEALDLRLTGGRICTSQMMGRGAEPSSRVHADTSRRAGGSIRPCVLIGVALAASIERPHVAARSLRSLCAHGAKRPGEEARMRRPSTDGIAGMTHAALLSPMVGGGRVGRLEGGRQTRDRDTSR